MKIWYQGLSSPERWGAYYDFMKQYVNGIVEPGTEVAFQGTPSGAIGGMFRSIELLSVRWLLGNVIKAEKAGYDAFAISNTLDVGLNEARELVNIPCAGILETALFFASMMGRNFSILIPNEKLMPMYEEKVAYYGYRKRMVSIRCLDFKTSELHRILEDKDYQARCLEQFQEAARKAIAEGAEVIIPLGGPLTLFALKTNVREIDGAAVLDPTASVIKMTETLVKLKKITGVHISRKLMYRSPSPEIMEQFNKAYGLF